MSQYQQPPSYDEQLVYDHLIACRKGEPPEDLLERFRMLFVDGADYADSDTLASLYRVVTSRTGGDRFKYMLNRSSRILIHYWWFQPGCRWAISELVYLLQAPPRRSTNHPAAQKLRALGRQFLQTEEYQALQRLAQVIDRGEDRFGESVLPRSPHVHQSQRKEQAEKPLRNLIHRYPYLYPHCLGGQSSSENEFETIRHLQIERQKKYERELAHYATQWVRQPNNNRSAIAVANPTLLSDLQLKTAIRHFTGPVEHSCTYRDLARRFVSFSGQQQSYRTFKEGLHCYLASSIDAAEPAYGHHHFHDWLHSQLRNTLPQSDSQPVSSFLVTRTCQQLVEALLDAPQQVGNHLVLVDLINNVGATVMTGLLLKLTLIYNNLKSAVEKRFSLLYKHYEPVTDGIGWLVETLENVQLAFSLHYSTMQLPSIQLLV
jgi:hypothetical protein